MTNPVAMANDPDSNPYFLHSSGHPGLVLVFPNPSWRKLCFLEALHGDGAEFQEQTWFHQRFSFEA